MKKTMSGYDLCFYSQVYKITEWKDGAVFKTQTTGKWIRDEDIGKLPKGFIPTSPSMKMMREKTVEIEVVDPQTFFGE